MDEHSIGLGICSNSRVLGSLKRKKKRRYVKAPENREWVSILETVNPAGRSLKPLIIFKGQEPQTS